MRLSDADGRSVGIWGAGREGLAAWRALRDWAAPRDVVVVTDAPVPDDERARFEGASAKPPVATAGTAGPPLSFADGEAGLGRLATCDLVIKSPGISRYRPQARELAARGALTSGTVLWLAEHADEPVIAVTGTKGKSTTASLLAHALRAAGEDVTLAGNVGRPLLEVLRPAAPPAHWVLELSSYQAADVEHSPSVVVLLNLTREHLDWHGDLERYRADKLNLLAHGPRRLVLNALDPVVAATAPPLAPAAQVTWFGAPDGFHVRDGGVWNGEQEVLPAPALPLLGPHNALNVCAVLATLRAVGAGVDPASAVRGFAPLRHRLEVVAEADGRLWVDDSISTTPEAAVAALDAFAGRPIALLAGGYDRRQDYAVLAAAVAARPDVRVVVGMPDNGPRILEAVRGAGVQTIAAGRLEDAVDAAAAALDGPGVVLLSPAAPSYGRFRDFEERGDRFAALALARAWGNVDGAA